MQVSQLPEEDAMSVQVKDQASSEVEVAESEVTGEVRTGYRSMTEFMDESVIGVTADLVVTGINSRGSSWMRPKYPPCPECNGWLMDIRCDSRVLGEDTPGPCLGCTFTEMWTEEQWAAFRARMDRLVAAWTVFYGPADPELLAERRAWIAEQHRLYPTVYGKG